MTRTLRDRRVEWGPVFILVWIGGVIFGAVLMIVYGLVPSDLQAVALLVLVLGPVASVAYVVFGLILTLAGKWLSGTVVGRRLGADPRPVSLPRVLAGVVAAGVLACLAVLGMMLLYRLAVDVNVVEWLGPHFHRI